jgi:hypothetical protein
MANTDDPRGFLPWQNDGKQLHTRKYTKTTGAPIYENDLVKRVAAGTVETAAAGDSGILGVAAHYAADAATEIAVYDDPDATFLCQTDAAVAYAVADDGQNVDIDAGTPDTALNRSGQVIDMSTKGTTATLPFKIIGLPTQGINGAENGAGTNATILVKINQCERGAGTAGV